MNYIIISPPMKSVFHLWYEVYSDPFRVNRQPFSTEPFCLGRTPHFQMGLRQEHTGIVLALKDQQHIFGLKTQLSFLITIDLGQVRSLFAHQDALKRI